MEYSKGKWEAWDKYVVCAGVTIAQVDTLANAYLIAAAPELYEACQLALQYFLAYDIENKVISGMSLRLHEVIAKAERKAE